MTELYTIGYGNRSKETVFDLLQRRGVTRLVDVRSVPYSRFSPAFTRAALEVHAANAGLAYTYLGEALGGKPHAGADAAEAPFRNGLRRLASLADRERTAILCAELRPEQCHRFRLVGAALARAGVEVRHIGVHGELVAQRDLERQVAGGQTALEGWSGAETTVSAHPSAGSDRPAAGEVSLASPQKKRIRRG